MNHTTQSKHHITVDNELITVGCKTNLHCQRKGEESYETYMNTTAFELFERRCRKYPQKDLMSYKTKLANGKYDNEEPFKWYTGEQALQKVVEMSSGIKAKYNLPKGSMVGVFLPNRAEWILITMALHRIGLVPVPLYATLGFSSINYVLDLTDIKLIFTSSETVDKIDAAREWMEYEKTITYRDQVTEEYKTLVTETANYILLTEGYGAFKQYLNDSVNAGFTQVQADKLLGEKKPVALGSLDPYDAWEFKASDDIMEVSYHKHELSFDYAIRDVNGNLYSEALVGGGYAAAYYIGDSGYTMLTGTVFIQEGCCATVDKPVQLLIRNDEGETLYRCELLSGYPPQHFIIDVSGEDKILIYFNGFDGHVLSEDDWYGGVGDMGFIK